MPDTARRAVPVMEACKIASVSRRTLYNWMRDGKVEFCRVASGSRRVYVDSMFRPGSEPTNVEAGSVAAGNTGCPGPCVAAPCPDPGQS